MAYEGTCIATPAPPRTPSTPTTAVHKVTSPPSLSAMAPPFVPNYAQAYQLSQPTSFQHQYLQPPLLFQDPYQAYPVVPRAQSKYGLPEAKFTQKRANKSYIKKKNNDMINEKNRMYQEWMLTQRQSTSPPISVTRKPSLVLPDGEYIGYYFVTEKAVVARTKETKGATSDQMSSMEQHAREGIEKDIVISPNDGLEYHLVHKGPTGILPLLPLEGPVFSQAKPMREDCAPTDHSITNFETSSSNFLPLLGPAASKAPKPALTNDNVAVAEESDNGEVKGNKIDSTAVEENVHATVPSANDDQAAAEYFGYAIVHQEPVAYLQARNTTT